MQTWLVLKNVSSPSPSKKDQLYPHFMERQTMSEVKVAAEFGWLKSQLPSSCCLIMSPHQFPIQDFPSCQAQCLHWIAWACTCSPAPRR